MTLMGNEPPVQCAPYSGSVVFYVTRHVPTHAYVHQYMVRFCKIHPQTQSPLHFSFFLHSSLLHFTPKSQPPPGETGEEKKRKKKTRNHQEYLKFPTNPSQLEMGSITTILGDDLLEEVFLRLASPVTIVRASAACKPWRRLVTTPSFLRRFHLLHPCLPLLGFLVDSLDLERRFFMPSTQPDPELAAAVRRADFSLSRVQPDFWRVENFLENVLLFLDASAERLAALDPLGRRCAFFDRPPSSFFNPDDEEVPMDAYYLIGPKTGTSQWFRVACITQDGAKLRVAVFSSDAEDWCFYPWTQMLSPAPEEITIGVCGMQGNGSLYWSCRPESCFLVLDNSTMEFSFIDIPACVTVTSPACVAGETEDGELCIVRLTNDLMLHVWIRSKEGDGRERWVLDKELSLKEEVCRIFPIDDEDEIRISNNITRKGYVYVQFSLRPVWRSHPDSEWLMLLHLKTMQLQNAAEEQLPCGEAYDAYPYTIAWPPSFRN